MKPNRPFFQAMSYGELTVGRQDLRKELCSKPGLLEKRIAILGGSTTAELRAILELQLLDCGIRPLFFESEFNQYFEDITFGNEELEAFGPEVVILHTTSRNLTSLPSVLDDEKIVDELIAATVRDFSLLWDTLDARFGCAVIQNNFDPLPWRIQGNLDGTSANGHSRFLNELNRGFALAARQRANLIVHDIDRLAAELGLAQWHDATSWHAYKCVPGVQALPEYVRSLAGLLRGMFGKSSKCLVLDLDNTLWGGVIGDDGVQGIRLGRESAEGEAYLAFQAYVKSLKERGVILAVCSKNEMESALEGLNHPDSLLSPDDFTLIAANWDPKPKNLADIAAAINIGLDSLVFVDDNPAEREIVAQQLPEVVVLDPGPDVSHYLTRLDRSRLFDAPSISAEDIKRSDFYSQNVKRDRTKAEFADLGSYLDSLEMVAEITPFLPQYRERITLLTNKTNQFNLTTRRCTQTEIRDMAESPEWVTLCGRLTDKFGDNGLVSVMAGKQAGETVTLDLWLMSCRVFKRDMELAMFDAFVAEASERGAARIEGRYIRTPKNNIVASLYRELGFTRTAGDDDDSTWEYVIPKPYSNHNTHIEVEHAAD